MELPVECQGVNVILHKNKGRRKPRQIQSCQNIPFCSLGVDGEKINHRGGGNLLQDIGQRHDLDSIGRLVANFGIENVRQQAGAGPSNVKFRRPDLMRCSAGDLNDFRVSVPAKLSAAGRQGFHQNASPALLFQHPGLRA